MKLKRFAVLSLTASLCLFAKEATKLDDVIITATKTENSSKDLTTSVQIIDSSIIENSGASNLTEILNNTAGVYISPSGTTYSIRGMNHSDTLILIDGKRLNGEFSKVFELERIPAGMIERIEILKGASSLLYGSDAMGSVINIITKKDKEELSGSLQIIGSKDKKAADFFVANKIGKTSFSLYSNYLDRKSFSKNKTANVKIMQSGSATSPSALSGGGAFANLRTSLQNTYTIQNDYIDNLTTKTIGGKVAYEFSDNFDIYLDFSYMTEDKDGEYISTSYPTNYTTGSGNTIMAKNIPTHQYNENERTTLGTGLNYFFSDDMDLKYSLAYSKYKKDRKSYTSLYNELGYSSLEDSAFSVNKSTLKHLDNELQFTHSINENNRYILGADYRINDTKSTAFNVDDRTYSSLYAQHEYSFIKDLKLIYGARYDKTSSDESETSLSFGGVYTLNDNLIFKANYAEGFRSPDDRELYVDQTTPTGKHKLGSTLTAYDLKSETSKTFELGLLASLGFADFEISAYKTNVDDRISEVSYSSYSTYENIDNSEIKGIETSMILYPMDDFYINLNFSFIDAKNKDTNEDLPLVPEKTAGLVLSYDLYDNINLKSITKYVGSQEIDSTTKAGSYTISNIKVNMTNIMKNIDVFAGVDNIFSKQVDENLGYIPETYVYAGIKYKF